MTTSWIKAGALLALLMLGACVYDESGNRRPLTEEERFTLMIALML